MFQRSLLLGVCVVVVVEVAKFGFAATSPVCVCVCEREKKRGEKEGVNRVSIFIFGLDFNQILLFSFIKLTL